VEWATLIFYHPDTDSLSIRAGFGEGRLLSERETETLGPPTAPADRVPVWTEMVQTRKPVAIYDLANDPRILNRALILAQGLKSLLYVPLLLGDELPGFLSINSVKPRHFSPQEIELAQALAQQISLAIQLTRMSEQANQTILLRERNRIAREIHDTLAQGFTGIVIQLEAADDTLVDAPNAARDHLTRARTLARDSLAEARRSVWALRSEHAVDLVSALRHQAESLIAGTNIAVQVTQTGTPRPVHETLHQHILRIGQESLTNALRHGQANHIGIRVSFLSEALELTIEDDGIGFDPVSLQDGFGLTGMRERAQEWGGTLNVESHPGKGTVVTARFPIKNP